MLREDLASGVNGVSVLLAPEWTPTSSEADTCVFDIQATGVRVWMLHQPLSLDLTAETQSTLEEDLQQTARILFRSTEALLRAQGSIAPQPDGRQARCDQPEWSPLIEHRIVQLEGRPILEVVHRTAYRPGCEFVMGHLLVPTSRGVLELRVIANDRTTGARESAMMIIAQRKGASTDLAGLSGTQTQAYYDDPAYDAAFPRHCLSRVRAILSFLREPGRIRYLEEPHQGEAGRVKLPGLGSRITLPPRFRSAPGSPPGSRFTRMNLALTDGVWRLLPVREPGGGMFTRKATAVREAAQRRLAKLLGRGSIVTQESILAGPSVGERLWVGVEMTEEQVAVGSLWSHARDGSIHGLMLIAPAQTPLAAVAGLLQPMSVTWEVNS
jgi:hypothetical protein